MSLPLTPEQVRAQTDFALFAEREIAPFADRFDVEETTPESTIRALAEAGYFGANVPTVYGGLGLDTISYGLLIEEIGKACSSIRSLLTVHGMVAGALSRWGSPGQQARWLPLLASGAAVAAFCLTEAEAGSDIQNIAATACARAGGYVITARKKWVTFGQRADVFLTFARCDGAPTAFLVERSNPGVSVSPISGMLGLRGAMLADVSFDGAHVSGADRVGGTGLGVSHIASYALDIGQYTVAWGCAAICRACLEASVDYAGSRRQFGTVIAEHQLVQRLITRMNVNCSLARLLCWNAGRLRGAGEPSSIVTTRMAKYFATGVANEAAAAAVQIHGARGCTGQLAVQRYFRDAKIMSIIEGSDQLQEIAIARTVVGV